MITLIVKGQRGLAQTEAWTRGLRTTFLRETTGPWTILETRTDRPELVFKWFAEPPFQAPYPEGTLLWFYVNEQPKITGADKEI